MQNIYIKNKNYSVESLPSEPTLLVHLLDLCQSDSANFEMFADAIRKDASLTAKVLQVANSPAYRQWNKISDVRRMLIILGMTNIKKIVTTCAIQQFFAHFTKSFSKHVQLIWLRSLHCANLAERLAKLTGYDKPGEAFLAGLLHQIGIMLLLLNREEEYLPVLERYYQQAAAFCSLEQKELQLDHCELGAALIQSWELDSFLSDAILFQHSPAKELISSPHLLKIMAVASPLSSHNNARNNPLYLEKAGQLFDMTQDTILDCVDLAVEKSQQMITDLGFSGLFYREENEENLDNDAHTSKTSGQLSDHVRDIALSGTIGRYHQTEADDFMKQTRIYFSTVFNLNQLIFFHYTHHPPLLKPLNDMELKQLDEIKFDTSDHHSLLVRVFQSNKAEASFTKSCSVADRQVIRLLDNEGVYLLPIHTQEQQIGVLAIGINQNQWPELKKKSSLLTLLSQEIAHCFFSQIMGTEETKGMSLVDFKKVAHEVSNPLTIINNYLYMLGKKIDHDHPAQEEIQLISEEIERTGQILLRAKDPDTLSHGRERKININQLINDVDTLFKGSLYKTNQIESTLFLDQSLPAIYCAKDKLKQILLNLFKNAVEAMAPASNIEVRTRDNFYQNGQNYIEISIKDNGPGIAQDVLNNLFQPVASTKEGHSGLGLSIVNTLVQELSGLISCCSKENEGTDFKILLPRITELTDGEEN